MDQNNQNPKIETSETSFDVSESETTIHSDLSSAQTKEKTPMGPIIGIIIIVIVLIIGGLYFWGQKLSNVDTGPTPEEITTQKDTAVEALKTQSTSDKVTSIETDLNSTNLGNLDTELKQIDTQLTF